MKEALLGKSHTFIDRLTFISGILICIYIFYATFFGPYKTTIVHRTIFLAVMLMIFFYSIKPQGKTKLAFVINNLLVCSTVFAALYVVFFYEQIIRSISTSYMSSLDLIVGLILILVVLEATRRTNILFFIFVLIAIAYTIYGQYIPGFFKHPGVSYERFIYLSSFSNEGIFGLGLSVASTYLFMFMIFGSVLQGTGADKFFFKIANCFVGKTRGGPAKAAVVASSLMGTMSGSSMANVVAVGSITIPLMKNVGFKPHIAAAIETLASEGGQIMPPIMGAAAFIMAEITGIPYGEIAIAAIVPAVLYYVSAFVVVDLEAAKLNIKGMDKSEIPDFKSVMASGFHYIIPIILLFYLLMYTKYSAMYAGIIATIATIVVAQFKAHSRMGVKKILESFSLGSRSAAEVTAMIGAVGLIQQSIVVTGLGARMTELFMSFSSGNPVILLIIAMIVSVLLGMGMPTPIAYMLTAVFIGPSMVEAGFPMIAAHMFLFFFAIKSGSTPPVAVVAMVAAGIAQADWWKTGWKAFQYCIPGFIIAYAFVFQPQLLLIGNASEIVFSCLTATIGTIGISIALQGYFLTRMSNWERLILALGSLFMIDVRIWSSLLGLLIVLGVTYIQIKKSKSQKYSDQKSNHLEKNV